MKQFYTLILLTLLVSHSARAQLVEIFPSLTVSWGLLIDGNTLYIAQSNFIKTMDITEDPPVLETFVSSQATYLSMAMSGAYLYYADYNVPANVRKLNINDPSLEAMDVTAPYTLPFVVRIWGDYLYYSVISTGNIFRINITLANPAVETVSSGITNNKAFAFKDNYIYIAEYLANSAKLFKLDYTDPTAQLVEVLSGLNRPSDMEFKGDELYISLTGGADKIVKTNVMQEPLVLQDVIDVENPLEMVFNGDDLYIINGPAANTSSLLKLDTSALGIGEAQTVQTVLYPNPTNNLLYIKGINIPMAYEIYDLMGRTLQKGNLDPGTEVDVSRLASGRYLLRMENGAVLDFMKK